MQSKQSQYSDVSSTTRIKNRAYGAVNQREWQTHQVANGNIRDLGGESCGKCDGREEGVHLRTLGSQPDVSVCANILVLHHMYGD